MKVKITKSVIVGGKVVNPGTDEPVILELERSVADNLIRIGCATDPEGKEIDTIPADKIIAANDIKLKANADEITDLTTKLDELTEYVKELEAELKKKDARIAELEAAAAKADKSKK